MKRMDMKEAELVELIEAKRSKSEEPGSSTR